MLSKEKRIEQTNRYQREYEESKSYVEKQYKKLESQILQEKRKEKTEK